MNSHHLSSLVEMTARETNVNENKLEINSFE